MVWRAMFGIVGLSLCIDGVAVQAETLAEKSDSASVQATVRTEQITAGTSPESACRGFGGMLYVSMINGEEPGDGTIMVIGEAGTKVFARGLNSPKGLAFLGNYLIVADETTIWKVAEDGSVAKLADAKDFPQPIEFLNDVAASSDGQSVYVTEMSNPQPMFDPSGERKLWEIGSSHDQSLPRKGCLYRVSLNGKVEQVLPAGLDGLRYPNGVAVTGAPAAERVFVTDFFDGTVGEVKDGKFKEVARGMRGADGLVVREDTIYVSSWTQGKVWQVDRSTGATQEIWKGLQAAADLVWDQEQKQLVVPDMVGGTLTYLSWQ